MEKNNKLLLKKITCNTLDKNTILDILNEYGMCILPNYISNDICDDVNCWLVFTYTMNKVY